jgi:serine/threonine protein kinase
LEISIIQEVNDVAPGLVSWERVTNGDEDDSYITFSDRVVFAPPHDDKEKLVTDLIDLLAKMNERGVVHRDLKPSHIGFDIHTGNMKLIDFGCSIPINRLPEVFGRNCGTSGWKAPELEALDFENYDEKVDIYSAGVSLMMMLVGREILNFPTLQNEFQRLRDVKEEIKNLVLAMVEADPQKRPSHSFLSKKAKEVCK